MPMNMLAAVLCACLMDGPAPGEIVPKEILVLPAAGRSGRVPVAADAIQASVVAGRWTAPKAGDVATLADGSTHAWRAIRVGDDGTFRDPALRGGYAFASIPSKVEAVMILEAAGHNMVYNDGEPRVGDPYSHGYVRVPIHLKAGDNPLLFAAGRGMLRLKLVPARAEALIDPADATLSDLVAGRASEGWGAVVVANASTATLDGATLRAEVDGRSVETPLSTVPPLGIRKVPFRLEAPARDAEGRRDLKLSLHRRGIARPSDSATIPLPVVRPESAQKRTFLSGIDGSVQYFGLVPASAPATPDGRKPGLILSLHGASVEGIGQARVYRPRPWAHLVAPTNRRPYGFDWEDWGRLDAMEVLDLASEALGPDPRRVYLTGHSMGGHGAWHLGVTFPGRFAAVAPSAGWVSMSSYAGAMRTGSTDPVVALVERAQSPSDTLALARNLERRGVYVLHGDLDDNVPVDQARTMRTALAAFHPDFAYYERPGAGHWWGDECCDWPPLMDFLKAREIPESKDVRRVDFATASPGVSARMHWATIEAQAKAFERSGVHLESDPDARKVSGTTENVARLALDLGHLKPGGPVAVTLDGQSIPDLPDASPGARAWLAREGSTWKRVDEPSPMLKGPHRSGPFKDAFRNRMVFVHGTKGSTHENAWAMAKARYDAETFWYRGNGSVDVMADLEFDPKAEPDRGVVLYGNRDTNAAWSPLLGDGPVVVAAGSIRVGTKEIKGDDLACLFVRPRPGSVRACVAAVSGTGLLGMRLTDRLPYFSSGVAYPDLIAVGPAALTRGLDGILGAGFFGPDWGVETGEFAWRR